MKKEKKIRNRSETQDRPEKVIDLRIYEPDKTAKCYKDNMGHDYRFKPFDRYGVCVRCGTEVLT